MESTMNDILTDDPIAYARKNALSTNNMVAARNVVLDLTPALPPSETAKLYRAIENALPINLNRVVQFVSAYENEGTHVVAFDTACIAATLIGKRVLYIDTNIHSTGPTREMANALVVPLDMLLQSGRPLNDALVNATGTSLYYTVLRPRGNGSFPLVSFELIGGLIASLRPSFDLVVISSEAVLTDVFGAALAKLTDGSILVVEAERTRAPVTMEVKRLIQSNGGNVLGAVLNRRRFYIPAWVYRLFWGSAKKS